MVSSRQKMSIHLADDPFLRRNDGELAESGIKPFCNIHEGEHYKKHQNIARQNHEENFFVC